MATLQPLFSDKSMRFIFVGGKGGVGKTTSASSLAIQLAKQRAPEKVLLISTDPAHNLSDAFQQTFGGTPTLAKGTENLYAMETDPSKVLESEVTETAKGVNDDLVADLREWISSVPGIDEAIALSTVMGHVDNGDYACVVFDTAPTGHTLRLLQLPSVLKIGIDKLTSWKARLGGLLSSVAGLVVGESSEDEAKRSALQKLEEKLMGYRAAAVRIGDIFRDHKRTTFVCVCIAEHLSVYETLRLIAELQQAKISSRYILVNQLVPQRLATLSNTTSGADNIAKALAAVGLDAAVTSAVKEACQLCGARSRLQAHYLRKLEAEVSADHAVVLLPLLKSEVRGTPALASFSENMVVAAPLKTTVDEDKGMASILAKTNFEALSKFGASLRLRIAEEDKAAGAAASDRAKVVVDGGEMKVGDTVEVFGLTEAPQYNGRHAVIQSFEGDRAQVSLKQTPVPPAPAAGAPPATLRKLSLARGNVRLVASELKVGDTVEVFGLAGAAQYNGQHGVIKSFDAAKGRYAVQLQPPSGDAPPTKKRKLSIKRVNLKLIVQEAAAAAAGGAATAAAGAAPPVASAVAALDPSIKQELMTLFMTGKFQAVMAHPDIQALRKDPDTAQFFTDLDANGVFGVMQYLGNETVMNKLIRTYDGTIPFTPVS